MPREKRVVVELRERAINSLVLAIEIFNRPHENGRSEGTLIFLHHAFEMLLKAIIWDRTGSVHAKGSRYSYSFDQCLCLAENELEVITKDERSTLSILDSHRDTVVHYYQDISEDMLYMQAQASVTLFDDILRRAFSRSLSVFISDRILPISARPPKDIQLLLDAELGAIDELLTHSSRKGIQASARLRSVMALATSIRTSAERVTERELRSAIQRRRAGEDWKVIFPEMAQLRLDAEGDGIPIALRIKNEGFPVRIVRSGEEAIVVGFRDWFDKYNLSLNDIAGKLSLTVPRTRALMFELGVWDDPEMFGEKRIKSQRYKRYTKKALDALRDLQATSDVEEIWNKNKNLVLRRRRR